MDVLYVTTAPSPNATRPPCLGLGHVSSSVFRRRVESCGGDRNLPVRGPLSQGRTLRSTSRHKQKTDTCLHLGGPRLDFLDQVTRWNPLENMEGAHHFVTYGRPQQNLRLLYLRSMTVFHALNPFHSLNQSITSDKSVLHYGFRRCRPNGAV